MAHDPCLREPGELEIDNAQSAIYTYREIGFYEISGKFLTRKNKVYKSVQECIFCNLYTSTASTHSGFLV